MRGTVKPDLLIFHTSCVPSPLSLVLALSLSPTLAPSPDQPPIVAPFQSHALVPHVFSVAFFLVSLELLSGIKKKTQWVKKSILKKNTEQSNQCYPSVTSYSKLLQLLTNFNEAKV